jgi:hypothetical protein
MQNCMHILGLVLQNYRHTLRYVLKKLSRVSCESVQLNMFYTYTNNVLLCFPSEIRSRSPVPRMETTGTPKKVAYREPKMFQRNILIQITNFVT